MAGRILIAGPGRAGTTLLVRLLDALGFETGADRLPFHERSRAGLESKANAGDAARVVKNPALNTRLRGMIEAGEVEPEDVEWLLVPLRTLGDAAASRVNVALEQCDVHAPGGLIGTKRPSRQRAVLAEGTYRLFETAALYELPTIVLEFPRFTQDPAYAFRRLEPLLQGRPEEDFEEAWNSVVDPGLLRVAPVRMPRFADVQVVPARFRAFVHRKLKPAITRAFRAGSHPADR